MSDAARWLSHPSLVVLGWTVVLVLWETTAVALALATWRTLHHDADASRQHSAAVVAFAAAVLIALATPLLFLPRNAPVVTSAPTPGAPTTSAGPSRLSLAAATPLVVTDALRTAPIDIRRVAGAIGLAWLAGMVALAVRFAGGWTLAQRLRRRAAPSTSAPLLDGLARLRSTWHRVPEIAVVESDRVEAPAVIGWRRPALVVPSDLAAQLPDRALDPLLAHELAHIVRGDYAANLLQSVADTLLFFSPGARWISTRVREAREFCCDDEAVRRCGGAGALAEALASLAALGSRADRRHGIAMTGPRLIVRIRRVLQGEAMPRYASLRVAALAAVLVIVGWTGVVVAGASLEQVREESPTSPSFAISFARTQPGASLLIDGVTSSMNFFCDDVTVRNPTAVPVSRLTFVAVLESAQFDRPVRTFEKDVVVGIPAQGVERVSVALLSPSEARAAMSGRIQVWCALSQIDFANGYQWRVTPNSSAETAAAALSLPPAEVSRSLVRTGPAPPSNPATADKDGRVTALLCLDDRQLEYSEGAVVPIRGEPGRFATCRSGKWYEVDLAGNPVAGSAQAVRVYARELQQGLAEKWAFKVNNACDMLAIVLAEDPTPTASDQRMTFALACHQAKGGDYDNTARLLERAGFPIEKPGPPGAFAPTVESARQPSR